MNPTNFLFLQKEFPILFNIGMAAEYNLHTDPITTLFKLRQFGERLSEILFEEHHLDFPSENTFHTRLKTLEFEKVLPRTVTDFFFLIKDKGNIAVHQNKGTTDDAKHCLFSAFKLSKWFYETYSQENSPIDQIKFSVPEKKNVQAALEDLELQYSQLEEQFTKLLEERKTEALSEEQRTKIQTRSVKAANKLEMSEPETRELIDAQLVKAGWLADTEVLNFKKNKTLPQRGQFMAIAEWPAGPKWADYALFVGTELYGIVEAKKYGQDISTDLRQSKIYAENLAEINEAVLLGKWQNYKAPFLFSTNGRPYLEQIKTKSGVWFLDTRERTNTSRLLQGWYSPEGLIQLFGKDIKHANKKLAAAETDFLESKTGLGLRKYQLNAIKAVEDAIIRQPDKTRALIAMATGTGKTEEWRSERQLQSVCSYSEFDPTAFQGNDGIPKEWSWMYVKDYLVNYDSQRVPISQRVREKRKGEYPYYGATGIIDTIDGFTHEGEFILISEDGKNLTYRNKPISFLAKGKIWVNNHAHILGVKDGFQNSYAVYCFNSINLSPYVTGIDQVKLSQQNLNTIPLAIPPKEEQQEIVRRVKELFAMADKIEAAYQQLKEKIDALPSATLAKAFKGELVAQDANDEPASELLKRIQQTKGQTQATGKRRKMYEENEGLSLVAEE